MGTGVILTAGSAIPPPERFIQGCVLPVNKPYQWTSFDVVNKIRHVLKQYTGQKRLKVGHAGTLDPLATGLLIVCTGKSTRNIAEFQLQEKEYTGVMKMGATTPSYDLETAVDHRYDISGLSPEALQEATRQFTGEIEQSAPVHSAVKIGGERSYEKARRGEEVPVKIRRVRIPEFILTHIGLPDINFRVVCSKGTYIRSLVHDFGRSLNNGAHLTVLTRTRSGPFGLDQAWELPELAAQIGDQC